MRDLVEQTIDAQGRRGPLAAHGRGQRSVTVNRRESPLAWLAARKLVTARQNEAGERLQVDHERAALGPAVTMRWAARVDGGGGARLDPAEAQLAAKRRFDAAIAAAGPGLSDVLWRVVCAGESLPDSERALGWPTRSGRLVLTLALDRLADHYRLP
ncbi:hypothetical protein ASE95_09730 [Sphingomonas sp. Leaf231]|uniref:DUF6456 domain-containing protein n=1 Tax=Sphingomonas sp. Leaf231 TaxID=1736301 RepID=UPI0006FA2F87|nr:DUF6456 domain-containing protein [Sphingomonas sp. Leaf231]KQN92895.1 hypothetical protein ASE95_09730 [Sphingomonas sp. Leaf231]